MRVSVCVCVSGVGRVICVVVVAASSSSSSSIGAMNLCMRQGFGGQHDEAGRVWGDWSRV